MNKKFSFRFRITVTLFIVIATVSFFSFYYYNNILSKIIHKHVEENTISVLYLLKDQYYTAISEKDGSIIYSILKKAGENKRVLKTYLIDSTGRVIYPDISQALTLDSLFPDDKSILNNEIIIRSFETEPTHYLRAFIRMQNNPKCYSCHLPEIEHLGYIVLDFSMEEAEKEVAFSEKFSFLFTGLMILVIVATVILLHFKFVKSSIRRFQASISMINKGNLDERIQILETKELGLLGRNFNEMMDKFQATQKELQSCYKKELKNKQKLATIGEISARLAHEIRNPITGIANAIEVFSGNIKDKELIPIIEEIKRQADRVNQAITNLLKYSRAKELNIEEQDVNLIIESLVFFLQNQQQNKNVKIKTKLQNNLPKIFLDKEQIENALLNLGLNAIHATNFSGVVEFSTSYISKSETIKIVISDNGNGILKKDMEKIFKPFFTTKTEGTGLGLAIVKDIIDKHKGTINVKNNHVKGCSFTILLPVSPNNISV